MNFLQHLFLDSGSDDALLGSLLGDFVKKGTPLVVSVQQFRTRSSFIGKLIHLRTPIWSPAIAGIVSAPCGVALRESSR